MHYLEQDLADVQPDIDPERVVVAPDDGAIVGVSADFPLRMSAPCGGPVAAMGITWVSVEITYRRRGVLRAMIERQLREHAAAGFAASVLTAGEGGIYGVAGGPPRPTKASPAAEASGSPCRPAGRSSPGGATGGAPSCAPNCARRSTPRRCAGDGPQQLCWLVDYVPVTAEAHAAPWQTLLGMDLVGSIESYRITLDDPLPYLFTDYRRVETTHVGDGMRVGPLDVATPLSARNYAVEVETVLEVVDPLLGTAV